MRKRRFPSGGVNEALQTLRTAVGAAAAAQQRVPSSVDPAVPAAAPLPAGIHALNDLGRLGSLPDEDLAALQLQIPADLARVEGELEAWEDLGKQLRSALDAALLIITLKSEPGPPKRRRTAAPQDGEDSGEGVEDAGSGEDEAAPAGDEPGPVAEPAGSPEAEAEIKTEDSDGAAGGEVAGKQSGLTVGRQVAFKVPKSAVDEWIQCEIIRVLAPGMRFEVRDPEPDDDGNPGKTYVARMRDIMPLPRADQPIRPIPAGAVVFARYPDTTAFYKARVTRYSAKKRVYYLRFEGEEDAHKEIEVSDLLVITSPKNRR